MSAAFLCATIVLPCIATAQAPLPIRRERAPETRITVDGSEAMFTTMCALLAAGYRIDKLTLIDLFPQTFHIETVVHLQLT